MVNYILSGLLALSIGFFIWVTTTVGFSLKFSLFLWIFSAAIALALFWNYTQVQSDLVLAGLFVAVLFIASAAWINLVQNSPSLTGKTPEQMELDRF